jgi:anti-sigma-K factor RskA
MNEKKLKQLFSAARQESVPMPAPDFVADVLRSVRQEMPSKLTDRFSIFEQLNRWFPRVALAASVVIILCVAADYGLTAAGLPELSDSISQASSQLFFDVEDL